MSVRGKTAWLLVAAAASLSLLGAALLWTSSPKSAEPKPPEPKTPESLAQDRAEPSGLEAAPAEVRAFLDRVLAQIPEGGSPVASFDFHNWSQDEKPTREGVGIKPIPGVDPQALIARVMDVDNYVNNITHVEECRSIADPAFTPPAQVRFHQRIRVPGVTRIQQELVLVDAGTINGYHLAYWYLLKPETQALDTANGARSAFNIGAWFAAPGVVGYALSSWPLREDVNALQWISLTRGADGVARSVIEGNIDGMAAWAKRPEVAASPPLATAENE